MSNENESDLVTIAEFQEAIEAEMAQQTLADEGIEAFVFGENATNVFVGVSLAKIQLQVKEELAERAVEVLKNANKDVEPLDEDADVGEGEQPSE